MSDYLFEDPSESDNSDDIKLDNYYDAEELPAGGWPGDGSGTDDFADFNANEADDYRNE